jgi:diguanylate cyclase (GGDEF)-like protein
MRDQTFRAKPAVLLAWSIALTAIVAVVDVFANGDSQHLVLSVLEIAGLITIGVVLFRLRALRDRRMGDDPDGQREIIHAALDVASDGFAIWKAVRNDAGDVVSFDLESINKAGAMPTGRHPSQLEGKRIEDVLGPEQFEGLVELFTNAIVSGETIVQSVEIESDTGWSGTFENTVVPFGVDRLVASFRDVSEDRRERKHLKAVAETDHLTGIANRARLEQVVGELCGPGRTTDTPFLFSFVDIDNFKYVNDAFGHDAGDTVLRELARRITASVDTGVVVGRIAGDEFAIIAPHVSDVETAELLMSTVFDSVGEPFQHEGQEIPVTISAGCILANLDSDPLELMRNADKTMYRAKKLGKKQFLVTFADAKSGGRSA